MDIDLDDLTPASFRQSVMIQTPHGLRSVADAADPWQLEQFEALDNGWRAVCGLPPINHGPTFNRCWRERPRGHSKSSDAAVEICYALVAAPDRINGVVVAGDEDQAALCRDAIDRLVRSNAWLAGILKVDRRRAYNIHTGSECVIQASDVATSFGLLVDYAYCDEVVHWKGRELFDSLLSAAAKKANCLLLCATNCGWLDHWSWPLREAIRADHDWSFQRLEQPCASWITAKQLQEQQRLLPPAVYSRLWGNQWCASSGDALEPSHISRAVRLSGPAPHTEPGWAACAGLDIGLKHDATSISVCARHVGHWQPAPARERPVRPLWMRVCDELDLRDSETGERYVSREDEFDEQGEFIPGSDMVRLLATRHLVPTTGNEIRIEQIEAEIYALNQQYRLSTLYVDPWQGQYLAQRLRSAGINVVTIDAVPANLKLQAQYMLDSFREQTVQIFEDDVLLKDLSALRIREMMGGGFRLFANRGEGATRHADAASAFMLALMACRQLDRFRPVIANNGAPLICWP